jgi:SulP family sulfate permease
VTATLAAVMVQHLLDHGVTSLLEPTLIVLALSTALTGALLCVLGFTNAGRAIRFVPYPVIGGFLGATGWLMILGAIQVVTDQRMTLEGFEAFASGPIAAKLAAGVAVALVLRFLMPLSHNPFMMPGILLAAIVVMYVALPLTGDSLADAQARGWTFQPQHLAALSLPLTPDTVRAFPWAALRHCPATCWRSCS